MQIRSQLSWGIAHTRSASEVRLKTPGAGFLAPSRVSSMDAEGIHKALLQGLPFCY